MQGRKIPKRTWKKFLKVLAENASSVTGAANMLNITPRSFYNHCYEDSEFAEEARKIFDAIRIPFAEDALFALVAEKNPGAIKFLLTRRGGRRWNPEPVRGGPELERDKMKRLNEDVYVAKFPSKAALAAKKAYADSLREGGE